MKLYTVVSEPDGELVYGSPKYPQWISDEPDIYVAEREYSDEEYGMIRSQADGWMLEVRDDTEYDHGYSQVSSDTKRRCVKISDKRILVKDGVFFGVTEKMYRRSYFYRRVYVSIHTADTRHGLWTDHAGYSSDNGSSYEDTVLYLRRTEQAKEV